MAVTVKKITLWRGEVDNRPGALARVLASLGGVDLQVVMGYRFPGDTSRAAVEVYPVPAKKTDAASGVGLAAAGISALLASGDNRPGLGHDIARAMGDAGINMTFLVAQVLGRRYSAVLGFENENDAMQAVGLIKKAVAPKKAPAKAKPRKKK